MNKKNIVRYGSLIAFVSTTSFISFYFFWSTYLRGFPYATITTAETFRLLLSTVIPALVFIAGVWIVYVKKLKENPTTVSMAIGISVALPFIFLIFWQLGSDALDKQQRYDRAAELLDAVEVGQVYADPDSLKQDTYVSYTRFMIDIVIPVSITDPSLLTSEYTELVHTSVYIPDFGTEYSPIGTCEFNDILVKSGYEDMQSQGTIAYKLLYSGDNCTIDDLQFFIEHPPQFRKRTVEELRRLFKI
jgi:hypothetical protein